VVCESHLGTHSQQYVDASSQRPSASRSTARRPSLARKWSSRPRGQRRPCVCRSSMFQAVSQDVAHARECPAVPKMYEAPLERKGSERSCHRRTSGPVAHGHRGHRRAGRPASGGSRIASGASRLCRPHCGDPVFVDLDDVAAGVCAAREPFEAFRSPEDDRVGVGAGLDLVPLFELPVEERVQPVPAGTEGIDLAHGREYRKPPVSEIGGTGLLGYLWSCMRGRT
jgi:hypothetical protein